jgi:hypothetical protein
MKYLILVLISISSQASTIFDSDDGISLKIEGGKSAFKRKTDPTDATLVDRARGESIRGKLSARGALRLAKCMFPLLKFTRSDSESKSILIDEGQTLYIVTHCEGDSPKFNSKDDSLVVREYLAYQIYHLINPISMRVRMARIQYNDTGSRLAFIVEDINDVAKRLQMSASTNVSGKTTPAEALFSLFQILIGNSDFERSGHNVFTLKDVDQFVYPVPYDFNGSYFAYDLQRLTNEAPLVRGAKTLYPDAFQKFIDVKPAIIALVNRWRPHLPIAIADGLIAYIESFLTP